MTYRNGNRKSADKKLMYFLFNELYIINVQYGRWTFLYKRVGLIRSNAYEQRGDTRRDKLNYGEYILVSQWSKT